MNSIFRLTDFISFGFYTKNLAIARKHCLVHSRGCSPSPLWLVRPWKEPKTKADELLKIR